MQNNPLHIQPIQEGVTNPLKYDFLTFVGLDAVDSILLEQRDRSESISLNSLSASGASMPFCVFLHVLQVIQAVSMSVGDEYIELCRASITSRTVQQHRQ